MATSKQKVEDWFKFYGGSIDIYRDPLTGWWCADLDAPEGFRWDASQTHCNCACASGFATKAEMWEAAWFEIQSGVTLCNDPGCEHCHPVEEDD